MPGESPPLVRMPTREWSGSGVEAGAIGSIASTIQERLTSLFATRHFPSRNAPSRVASQPEPPEPPAVLRRAGGVAGGHLDAVGRAAVAGVAADEEHGGARRGGVPPADPRAGARADRRVARRPAAQAQARDRDADDGRGAGGAARGGDALGRGAADPRVPARGAARRRE